ncbi:MAG: DedA family protein [Beijerinckiaceae bacterium]|nr:DedA family protein [Beijerinckiaceae bacterium]
MPDLSNATTAAIDFARLNQGWIPLIVFLIGLAKSLAIVSLLVPGVVILVAIGALAAASGQPLWHIVLADGLGATLGYALSFWAGRYWSESILTGGPLARYPQAIARSQAFFEKYGVYSVFLGHFFGPVRAFIAIIAGVSRMRELPFQVANVTSGFLWSFGVLAPSYYGVSSGAFDLLLARLKDLF